MGPFDNSRWNDLRANFFVCTFYYLIQQRMNVLPKTNKHTWPLLSLPILRLLMLLHYDYKAINERKR